MAQAAAVEQFDLDQDQRSPAADPGAALKSRTMSRRTGTPPTTVAARRPRCGNTARAACTGGT
jgi:hypothetical protein